MKRTDNILLNIAIAINALLVFLLIFESRITIPKWLQVVGRMHPLILHFPIALIVFVAAFTLYRTFRPAINIPSFSVWQLLAAVTAAITALSGLFLSQEDGYDSASMNWHKCSGVILSLLLLVWSLLYETLNTRKLFSGMMGAGSLIAVLLAGHQGANITHGENFLLAPVMKADANPAVMLEDAMLYQDMVHPILEAKCMGCHNKSKAKGELVMETEAQLLKGGKNGKLWNIHEPGFGLMMQRIHLPVQDKKHMPPKGKPQLTPDEIFIIEQWLEKGASFKQQVAALPENDTLRIVAANRFSSLATEAYDFASANASTVKQLNSANRTVYPLAINEPALAVDFFGRSQYQPAQLKELLEVKEQIVSLNLNKMPVKDEELNTIREFRNLRKLNLSFTDITGKNLSALQSLKHLQQLSISGTAVTAKDIAASKALPKLSALYAWNTKVKETERSEVQQTLGKARIQWGFSGDTITLKLNAPIIENEVQIITDPIELKLKHFLPGVSIRYTLDGTEPDSIHSQEYKAGIMLNQQAMMKAKAFKAGWISSDVSQLYFFKNKYKPDSVQFLLPADNSYKGSGATTVNDNIKGDKNFRSGKWLGFKNNNMDMLLHFKTPTTLSSVTLSSLIDIGSYIMPPLSIEVWGGGSPLQLKLLQKINPLQPIKVMPAYLEGFDCSFAPHTVQYLRIVAKPVGVLPAWHPGKGDKGWVFVDEIFVN